MANSFKTRQPRKQPKSMVKFIGGPYADAKFPLTSALTDWTITASGQTGMYRNRGGSTAAWQAADRVVDLETAKQDGPFRRNLTSSEEHNQ